MSDRLSNHIRRPKTTQRKIIGLIPAAGEASRLSPLPFSKEVYPIAFHRLGKRRKLSPKPVCLFLLERMRLTGVTEAYIILREGKWDIPTFLGDGKMLNMHLAYLMMDLPFGVPYTLDQAYPFVEDAIVVFGFPDIIFHPKDAFQRLLAQQAESHAEIVLGLFPVRVPQKWDMVDLESDGHVRQIVIKPPRTQLRYCWIIAVWTPVFTRFMHDRIQPGREAGDENQDFSNIREHQELFMGDVIQDAIHHDMQISTVVFRDGECLDIGTVEDLKEALRSTCCKPKGPK